MPLPLLPQDVIHNILSLLPVKSPMRFRCVSKSWNSQLHDPLFIKLHLHRALKDLNTRRVLVCTDPPQCILLDNIGKGCDQGHDVVLTMPVEYPPRATPDDIEIIGSCNGLLCFMVVDSFTEEECVFILWNPSTRACRELAKPGRLQGQYPDIVVIFGFGYDPETNDYKIIRAVSPYKATTSTKLEIYSLKSNLWRKMQVSLPCILTGDYWRSVDPTFPGLRSRGAGVHTDGAVHWLVNRKANTHESDSYLILSFNLAKERFEELPLMNYRKEDSSINELQLLGGHLSVQIHKQKTSEIEVWVMKEYGVKCSWIKITTMPENPGHSFADSFYGDWLVPFSVCKNGCLLVDMDGNEILINDPQRMTFCKIELGAKKDMFLVQEYVESLVSPYSV